ncbi:LuxR C-terminal-related transcriptional regulator [Shivajiella indica]|uniref:LuxR C-terminal-related transcriptional regulator n=1 Tax=Shivajiella indica TaxID=872115 RepID=A0ABW5B5N8_9BACT
MKYNNRIVIIEKDQQLRECYKLIIKSVEKFFLVNTYSTCEEAFPNLQKDRPNVILMDLNLSGVVNGIEGTKYIISKYPYIEVLIIAENEDNDLVFEAFRAGASGFIEKSYNYLELLSSLDELVKGGAPMSSKIARLVISNFHSNPNSPLSEREKDVLKLIAEGKSYSQIADTLFISKETSKTHIKNIYAKLEVNSKAEALELAREKKYL